MATAPAEILEPVTPSEMDIRLALESSRRLALYLARKKQKDLQLQLVHDGEVETIAVPLPALRLLFDILNEMAQGNAVTLIPVHAELTTQQAAEVLHVSRPFLIGLLDDGKIPYRKVGTHRRVLFRDVMEYKRTIDASRLKAFEELSAQAWRIVRI